MNNQKGFTLIELVVVIVILGILAATAAPRFIDLQDDAETSVINGVKGALQSAATMVHSKSIIDGNQDSDAAGEQVTTNAGNIDILFGYPEATSAVFDLLLDLDMSDAGTDTEFTFFADGTADPKTITFYPQGREPASPAVGDNCSVTYTEVGALNGTPSVDVTPCT